MRKVNQIPWEIISTYYWEFVLRGDGTYNECGNEPDDSRQEGKGLGSLPASAYIVAVADKVPVPDTSTRKLVDCVDQETESSEPGEGDEHINWIMLECL